MGSWADDLERIAKIRNEFETEPGDVDSSVADLLELAHSDQWTVRRGAVAALGAGLSQHPTAGVSALDTLIQTALDRTVPSPDQWSDGLNAVVSVAPEVGYEAVLEGFEAVAPNQRDEAGERCLARAIEYIAVNEPAVLVGSLDSLRTVCRSSAAKARRHLLSAHLALVDSHRDSVRPVVSNALAEFESGDSDTRRVAADLLCALATHPEDGARVSETMLSWLATHPRHGQESRAWHSQRESFIHPSLTGSPSSGIHGVAQVLARIAEETPGAVVPHCKDIAQSLATWESTKADQWPRSHLARAVAAVARQQPQKAASTAEFVSASLADDSEFVRYWVVQTIRALWPFCPEIVSPAVIRDVLTDPNPDIRELGTGLAKECVADGVINSDAIVTELRDVLSDATVTEDRRVLDIIATVSREDPASVQPLLPVIAKHLDEPITASDAATVFETVAHEEPAAVADAVPQLVDCVCKDSVTVRTAAAETLATIGRVQPSLLDDQLEVLATSIESPHAGVDSVGDVLVTVPERPLATDETVFEFICSRTDAEAPEVRRTATQLLGTFVEADTETEAGVAALKNRLADTDTRVREAAIEALAAHIAETGEESIVRSCYLTETSHWQSVSATLLARATLYNVAWPSTEFQHWLSERIAETTGETCRSFIEAARHICGQIEAEEELVSALVGCLTDPKTADSAFGAVQSVVAEGATTVPVTELAPVVEQAVLDPSRCVPPAGLRLLPHVASDVCAPQRVADRLTTRLGTDGCNCGQLAAALASVCRREVAVSVVEVVEALERYAVSEPLSAQDWGCQQFGRVLRELDGSETVCETFVPMVGDETIERQAAAANVLASLAEVWPAGVRPAAEMLQEKVDHDNEEIRAAALAALVAIGRKFPTVLYPISGWLTSSEADSKRLGQRRRRYEGIALLAADGISLDMTGGSPLNQGLLADDTATNEFALEAAAELDDPRVRPLLARFHKGVPNWDQAPAHCSTGSDEDTDRPFGDLLTTDERTLTASDVLNRLE